MILSEIVNIAAVTTKRRYSNKRGTVKGVRMASAQYKLSTTTSKEFPTCRKQTMSKKIRIKNKKS